MKTVWKFLVRALTFLIILAVPWAAFEVATTRFETDVVAGLALVYGFVRLSGLQQVDLFMAAAIASQHQFNYLASHLNHPSMDKFVASLDRTKAIAREMQERGHVEGCALGLVGLYALWRIFVGP